jgi:hypothetical protein
MSQPHVHTFTPRGMRFVCTSCGVVGHKHPLRGPVVPYLCQYELAARKHCAREAVHVTGQRTASRCAEHGPTTNTTASATT